MSKTLRAFIAVPIPETVTVFLQQVQQRLQAQRMNIRWVIARNVHLTLKFLGDIEASRVPAITSQMDAAAATTPSFSLNASGVGVFPNHRRARVWWVGVAGDIDRLHALQSNLEAGLAAGGFGKSSRDFRAHLTIGRTRRRINAKTVDESLGPLKDTASGAFRVDRLVLFQSILKPDGAEYTRLHTSYLANEISETKPAGKSNRRNKLQ